MAGGATGLYHRPPSTPHRLLCAASDLQSPILSLRTDDINLAGRVREYEDLKHDLGLPPDFERRLQAAKRDAIRSINARPGEIHQLFSLGARRNTIRAFAGSLRPAASGMQSRLNCCIFAGKPGFPAQPDTVRLWSFLFRPGRAFRLYLSHLMKATTILLHQPTDWMSPDIRSVARGLANAQDVSFRFQNYMFAVDLLRRTFLGIRAGGIPLIPLPTQSPFGDFGDPACWGIRPHRGFLASGL